MKVLPPQLDRVSDRSRSCQIRPTHKQQALAVDSGVKRWSTSRRVRVSPLLMWTGAVSVGHGRRRVENYTVANCPADALLDCCLAYLPSPTPDPSDWERLVKRELKARGIWLHGSVKSALEHIDPLLVDLSSRDNVAPSLHRSLVQTFITVLGFRLASDSALRAKVGD